ncbi:MAG: N-6 DNA methylase, partial [Nitrospina sp.]|nr:N-6 DNA methylase [Nitrospina sp.]
YLDFALARVKDGYYQDGSKELPASILDQTAEIDDLLGEIKICDPAIGSGAFPVGMMTEIVRARQLLEVYLGRGQTAYRSKRHCIQESIYGVDIDSGAIDIAKLRLWLSLVVDEDDFASIKPLPNLDYKIMQGNSLLEEFEGVKLFDAKLLIAPAQDSEEMLAALKRHETSLSQDYIRLHQADALTKEKKILLDKDLKKIHKSIKKLQQSLGNNGAHQPSLFLTTQNKAVELKKLHDAFFDATRKPEKERLRQEIEKLTFELIRLTLREQGREEALARIEGAIRANTRPFFLWQLNFSDVFQGKGGFDVVIGNPPYVRHEGIKELKPQLKTEFGLFFRGTADLYTYFYKRGLDILHDQGHLCYIAPNKFMRAAYGGNTRKLLTTKATPGVVIDFGDLPIFDATTYPAILLLKKGRPESKSKIRAATFTEEKEIHSVHKTLTGKGFSMPVAALKQEGWNLEPPEVLALMDKLREAGKPLGEYVEGRFYRGVLTGFNKAFVIDEKIREQLLAEDPKSDELIKPWVRGRDIKRWQVVWAGLYVINIPSSTNRQWPWSEAKSEEKARVIFQESYSAVYQHLIQWEENLRKRDDQGKFWWELRSCAYHKEFEQPKIIWGNLATTPKFVIDYSASYVSAPANIIPINDLYLLAILNTQLCRWVISLQAAVRSGGFLEFKPMYVGNISIFPASTSQQASIIENVERILDDPQSSKVSALEQEIDARVAHLYNLTEEEYNLILNKTNTPDLFRVGALNIFRDFAKGIIQ